MGRMYSVSSKASGATLAQDLLELLAASTLGVTLHAVFVSQASDTDSEQLEIAIKRITGSPTSGSGGSAPTPTPLISGGASFGGTTEMNNTTKLSGGTSVYVHREAFNVLNGFVWMPTPEMRPTCAGGARFVVELVAAPADALDLITTVIFESG